MGKKKNKAKQMQLNASQAQNQPQPLPKTSQPCPTGTAPGAVAPTAEASSASQPKKKKRRMTKAEKRQRRLELGIGQGAEASKRNGELLQAQNQSSQPLPSATAFFSSDVPRQDTKSSRRSQRTRNNSFVGNTLLNVLEEVQGTKGFGLPQDVMTPNGLAMEGSNDNLKSGHSLSARPPAQYNTQNTARHASSFTTTSMPPPASTLPRTTSATPYGYNIPNATWNWNNPYGAGLPEGQNRAQASGYQCQASPPGTGSSAGVWGQAFAPMGQFGLPGQQMQVPPAVGQIAQSNPAWQIQGRLGQAGLPTWTLPHQRRTMEPTQHRGFASDSQTSPWRRNASVNGQQNGVSSQSRSPRKSPKPERPNKPGPPRPDPSPQYLAQSLVRSSRVTVPQRLLIVIDLNGTLLFRPKRSQSSHFIRRPFTRPFISYLFANHTIMVWSSARPENVNRMCTGLFTPAERKQLIAEWARDMLGLTAKQYNEKVQVFKELSKVWEAAEKQQWHPMHKHGQRFDQRNTLLIDDSVEKAASEPYNLVEVDDFEAKEDQMSRDVLREVAGYLEDAKMQTDVSAWSRAGNRFAYGKGWDRDWQEETCHPSASSAHLGDGLADASVYVDNAGQTYGRRVTRSQTQRQAFQSEGAVKRCGVD